MLDDNLSPFVLVYLICDKFRSNHSSYIPLDAFHLRSLENMSTNEPTSGPQSLRGAEMVNTATTGALLDPAPLQTPGSLVLAPADASVDGPALVSVDIAETVLASAVVSGGGPAMVSADTAVTVLASSDVSGDDPALASADVSGATLPSPPRGFYPYTSQVPYLL